MDTCLIALLRPKEADLSLTHLVSLKAADKEEGKSSVYAENGASKKRIHEVLSSRESSACNCKREFKAYCFIQKYVALS